MGSFALLPLHVVRLILMREELKADEFSKFQVKLLLFSVLTIVISGSLHVEQEACGQHRSASEGGDRTIISNTSQPVISDHVSTPRLIQFHMIPANILMTEIHGLNLVHHREVELTIQ